jgi:hypothetical protein
MDEEKSMHSDEKHQDEPEDEGIIRMIKNQTIPLA